MRLLLAFAIASFALTGCILDLDGDEYPPEPSRAPASSSSSSSSSGAPSSGPGTCAPNAACGGLSNCSDYCYGADCCTLHCGCDSSKDRLSCSMTCSK